MSTTKTLKLAFQNGKGKATSLTLANALDNLETDKIKDAMSKIANANVFEKTVLPSTQLLLALLTSNVL